MEGGNHSLDGGTEPSCCSVNWYACVLTGTNVGGIEVLQRVHVR